MSVEVRPVTADRWSDLVSVFGRRGDDPSWCWCRLFLRSAAEGSATPKPRLDNRNALRQEIVHAAVPPGLLAYVDGQPVGWSRVGPRSDFPRVAGNRALAKVLTDDPGAWWVTCFAVDSHYRRSGVGSALLKAAVELAREHGATAVEGHPVDVAGLKAARVGGSAVFTGTVAMFTAAGFTEIGRTYPTRPVMRLLV
ncbi:MAG: GNAT family N-acetyltransferase [Propionibacteriales bacterium]|nr:GNAT family N-acetyltransferase [Propionibacteriales bacterium]